MQKLGSMINPPKSFTDKYEIQQTGCWVWTASKTGGYGKYWNPFSKHGDWAHRFAYELLVGEIPEGLQLDHLCRNRACVNPGHLEPVTAKINVGRAAHPGKNKTHCPSGHKYDENNTYVWRGWRSCRTCSRESVRRSRAKRQQLYPQEIYE